jgi:hypothetical protein
VGAYAGAAASVIAVLPAALASWPAMWAAAPGNSPRALADAALEAAPARGVVAVRSEAATSALRYATAVEAARPDLVVRSRAEAGHAVDRPVHLAGILASRARAPARPALWEIGAPPPPGFELRVDRAPFGLLVAEGEGGGDLEEAAEILAVSARAARRDPVAARVHAGALAALGELATARGDDELARRLTTAARALDPTGEPAGSSAAPDRTSPRTFRARRR